MKHLKIYEAISLIRRQGSIRKAADHLAVSPSALNRSIQAFEGAIGFAVFERVPAGVRLTPAGELLLDVVERHLVEFDELRLQLGRLRDGHAGALRVGFSEDIATGSLFEAILDLEAEMPGVSVDVTMGDAVDLLRQREIDIAVVTNPETDRTVEVMASQKVKLRAWATAELAAAREVSGLWDLVQERLVMPPEGTGTRTVLSHAFRRHDLDERVVSSISAAHLPLAMGGGARVCLFPQTVFTGPTALSSLRRLPLEIGSVQVSVLRLSGVPLSTPAQRFLRQVEARLNAEM